MDQHQKRLVFYGAGRIAQIAYIVVANRDLKLVGVVDDERAGQKFFEYDVVRPLELANGHLGGDTFDSILLASHSRSQEMKESLEKMSLSPSRSLALFD